ncbi:MAG TPA: glycosyltransferase family 4 protein [Gemmatimonadales bacterium]|jgi:glycosyltransferase involved in cell wall biosynthesis|nr:glycosyltransferase family 4 protein [Gemmatimonadales bacterium]
MYPTPEDPTYGSFVATQMASVQRAGVDVEVDFVDGRKSQWEYARAIPRVRRRARSDSFDLIHAHYGLSGFVAAFHTLPLVVSFCGDDLLGTPDGRGGLTPKSRVGVRLSKWAARRADAIICKSEELRNALPGPAERHRAHVLGNGVDVERFSPGDRLAARRRLGVSAEERLVLFPHSRRQAAVKRFDLAESAIRALNQQMSTRLWVINDVTPDSMPDYYRAADCMLLTSDHEGSPNTVKEALCCDLPVVTVEVGDVREWLSLSTGCLLTTREPNEIARALGEVLRGPRRADGTRVRRRVRLSAVAEKVLDVYREALARRRNAGG